MSVAPSLVASCSLAGLVSIAMMRPAPAIAAPLIAAMPTPPQPITATVSPALTPGGIHHRAVAGDDAAADQRGQFERHVLADFDDGVFVHQHLLGERRQVEELVELLRARPGQPVGLAGQHLHGGVGAQHRAAGGAVVAGAAEHRQAGHDVIAGLHIGDVGADLFDDAGRIHGRAPPAADADTALP